MLQAGTMVRGGRKMGQGGLQPVGLGLTTPVATPTGWRRMGEIVPGDLLFTMDAGAVAVTGVERIDLTARVRAVRVPSWALGNRRGVSLAPGQGILLHEPLAEELYADPFAVLPIGALVGWRGIVALPHGAVPMVMPRFRAPQVIYAARELLVACPGEGPAPHLSPVPFTPEQARHLALCLMAEDLGAALRSGQAATGAMPS